MFQEKKTYLFFCHPNYFLIKVPSELIVFFHGLACGHTSPEMTSDLFDSPLRIEVYQYLGSMAKQSVNKTGGPAIRFSLCVRHP